MLSLESLQPHELQALSTALTRTERARLRYRWPFWARAAQLEPPGDWSTWLVMAGRGFGKTRMGAEWVRAKAETYPGARIALIGNTAADARDVMVEGESGLMSVCPPWDRPKYEPSKRRVTWPNGSMATTYSGDEPDQLRGPQHHFAWADELAKWQYADDAWSNLIFGLRLGDKPLAVVTTTPRPAKLLRQLMAEKQTHVTRGRTLDNVENMAASAVQEMLRRYEGTRLGRQELDGEMLDDVPGALWSRAQIDDARLGVAPDMSRVVVAIDPAVTSGDDADETGIVCVGTDGKRGYVLEDRSGRGMSPSQWAMEAITLYRKHSADRIVAEVNNGGEMVESVLRQVDPDVAYSAVRASRGKVTRAEPVAALYEQGRVHHVGSFRELEDQMCSFTADFNRKSMGFSPDRVDAMVWGLTELMLSQPAAVARVINY